MFSAWFDVPTAVVMNIHLYVVYVCNVFIFNIFLNYMTLKTATTFLQNIGNIYQSPRR